MFKDVIDLLENCVPNYFNGEAELDGYMYETYGAELAHVEDMSKLNRVVTVIMDEETCTNHYVSGMKHVNRIGYLVTENPITEEFDLRDED